jgi:CRP/FNR family transcriptional regulator, cyclic AMP receptor protein
VRHHDRLDDHLKNVPIFAHLSEKQRHVVRSLFTELDVEKGVRLTHQGDTGHEFFIVVSGTATVEKDGILVADLGPGDFVGELSLLDGGPQAATAMSNSPMTILVASSQEFATMLDLNPTVAREMLPGIVQHLRANPTAKW